jgi:hypothetical protein
MTVASLPPLYNRAAQAHAMGANVLAIRRGTKKPAHPWARWQRERQAAHDLAQFPWDAADRFGIINGVGGMRSFDIDGAAAGLDGLRPVWRVLEALGLSDDYPWVEQSASGNGWHIWFRCDEAIPSGALTEKPGDRGVFWGTSRDDTCDHIELRWESNQTIVASSDGADRWLNDTPSSPPARVAVDAVLGAFASVARLPERAATGAMNEPGVAAAHPPASPPHHPPRTAPVAMGGRDAKEDVKAAFDMVAYARQYFGADIQNEPGGEVRVLGNGGLLIKPSDGVWYRFSGEVGGDCFDLVGLSLFGPAWDRHDKGLFMQALRRAGEYVGIAVEATRTHALHVVPSPDEVQDGASGVQDADTESPWLRFLAGRESVWDAIENGVEEPVYLVSPIVLDGMVTSIFGGPEQGKTWILLHVALETVRQGKKVLFLDEESGMRFIKERMKALGFTKADDPYLYYFAFKAGMTLDDLANAVLDGVIRERFSLICCDSISKLFAAAGLDENSNTDATTLMRAWITPAAHVYGCAVLGLDHIVKVEEEGRYGRGAGSKLADVDVQWHIQATVPPSRTSRGRIVLTNKKDRTAWVPKTVRYLAGGDGEGGVKVVLEETSDMAPPPIRENDRAAVIALYGGLNSGKRMSDWQAAAKDLGVTSRTIINMAHRLIEQRVIAKNGDLYYVTAEGAKWCNLGESDDFHHGQGERGEVKSLVHTPRRGVHQISPPADAPAPAEDASADIPPTDEEEWTDGKPPF